MATLHLEFTVELTDDYNYEIKKSYKVKTIEDVYNYLNACFDDYYTKWKENKSCTQYDFNGKKITAFITKYGQNYSITEFENMMNS